MQLTAVKPEAGCVKLPGNIKAIVGDGIQKSKKSRRELCRE